MREVIINISDAERDRDADEHAGDEVGNRVLGVAVVKRNKSRSNDSCQEAEDSKDLQAFGARALAEDQRAVLAAQRAVVARRAASGHSEEF